MNAYSDAVLPLAVHDPYALIPESLDLPDRKDSLRVDE